MKCRTFLVVLAVALVTTAPFTSVAVAQTNAKSAAPVEITVAFPYGRIFRPVHAEIIRAFNKTHPHVKVTLEAPYPDYEDIVQRTRSGLARGAPPTLSFQGINQIRQFVDAGQAYDLSAFAAADPRWSDAKGYYPTMMALGAFNGKRYAIPFAVSTPILYFNADLFKAAGLDPAKPPQTWPEVIAAARAIQQADPGATGLFFDYQITGNWGFQALVASEGGAMMDASEKRVTFADAAGKRAAKTLRSFIDAGVMKDWSRRQGEQSFIAGRVGIYVSSTSWLKGVEDKTRFDLRTALFPVGSTGQRHVPSGGNAALVITKDAAQARAAYEYAMFAAGPVGTAIMVKGSGYMPMHAGGAAALKSFYAANPNFSTSLQQIPDIYRWYAFPGANQLKIIDTIRDTLQSIVAGRQSHDVALDNAAREVEHLVRAPDGAR